MIDPNGTGGYRYESNPNARFEPSVAPYRPALWLTLTTLILATIAIIGVT